jgi:hypothetical protein
VALTTADLDAWLPDAQVRTHHRRSSAAGPGALWAAAGSIRLRQTRTVGRLVRWRIPGVAPDQTFYGLLAEYPFTVLDAGEHHMISGLCGRIWTLARDYPRLDGPDAFCAWSEPNTVRVLFAHWVQRERDGRSTLVSEARVQPTDRDAAIRLRSLWLVVAPFERLIGAEPLALAAAAAEGGAAPEDAA